MDGKGKLFSGIDWIPASFQIIILQFVWINNVFSLVISIYWVNTLKQGEIYEGTLIWFDIVELTNADSFSD